MQFDHLRELATGFPGRRQQKVVPLRSETMLYTGDGIRRCRHSAVNFSHHVGRLLVRDDLTCQLFLPGLVCLGSHIQRLARNLYGGYPISEDVY